MMANLPLLRRLLKLVYPEATHWLGTLFYDTISSSAIFQRHYELVAQDILNHIRQGTLLDIGTGPAWLLLKIHQHRPEMGLKGIDASPAMLERAKQHIAEAGFAEAIEIKEGRAEKIPYPDGSFDIVVSTASVHHWRKPSESLNEIDRVLKPAGLAFLYDIVSDIPKDIVEPYKNEVGRLGMFLFWLHTFEEPFYSRESFGSLAKGTAFGNGQTCFVGLFYRLALKKA